MDGTPEKLRYFRPFRAAFRTILDESIFDEDNRKYAGDLDGDAFEMCQPVDQGFSDQYVKSRDSDISKVATLDVRNPRRTAATPIARASLTLTTSSRTAPPRRPSKSAHRTHES